MAVGFAIDVAILVTALAVSTRGMNMGFGPIE
jgi:hypothetical protein